jgi:hypothetical protein
MKLLRAIVHSSLIAMSAFILISPGPALGAGPTVTVNNYLYYSSKRGDPNLYKRAFVQERLLIAQLRAEELGFSQLQREAYYRTVYNEALSRAQGGSWNGGWTQAGLTGLLAGVAKGGAAIIAPEAAGPIDLLAPLVVGLGSKGIETGLSAVSTPGAAFLSPEEAVGVNAQSDSMRSEKDSSFNARLDQLDSDLPLTPLGIPKYVDKDYVGAQQQADLRNDFNAGFRNIWQKISNDRKITKDELNELNDYVKNGIPHLRDQMADAVQTLDEINARGQRAEEQAENQHRHDALSENISGPFMVAGALARLTGDSSGAQKFESFGKLSSTIFEISELTKETFEQQPFKCVNLYLFAASLVLDIAAHNQKSDLQVQLDAIQQLSDQIEEVRKQMHQRFDALEKRMDIYFQATIINLNDIKRSQELVLANVQSLNAQMDRLGSRLDAGVDQLAQFHLLDLETECKATKTDGAPRALADETQANRCFGGYMLIGAGRFKDSLRLNSAEAPLNEDRSHEEFNSLVALASQYGAISPPVPYPPAQFLYGAGNTLRLLHFNPHYKNIALQGRWLSDRPVMNELLKNGRGLDDFQKTMALKADGNGFRLRSEVFHNLLEQYLNAANAAIHHADTVIASVIGQGPVPAPARPSPRGESTGTRLFESPPYDFEINNSLNSASILDCGHAVPHYGEDGNWIKTGMSLYPYLPKTAQWALRFQSPTLNFQMKPCVSRFNVHLYTNTRVGVELEVILKAEYTSYYDGAKNITERAEVNFGALHGDGIFLSGGALNIGPRELLRTVWTGLNVVVENYPTFLFGYPTPKHKSGILYKGILNNPVPYFGEAHEVTSTGDLESQKRFAKRFDEILEEEKQDAVEKAKVNAPPPNAATDSIVSQLMYLTSEGMDLNEPRAMALYSILRSGTLPSRDEIIYRYLNEGQTPSEATDDVTFAVNQVRSRLIDVYWDKNLRPPGSAIQIFADALDKLANGAAAPAPRGWPGRKH